MRALVVLVLLTGSAHAEPDLGVAVNTPLMWKWSIAGSGWVGLDAHDAIRVNIAHYSAEIWPTIVEDIAPEGPRADFGTTTDVGVGWVYFLEHVLEGPSVETGVLVRIHRERDAFDAESDIATRRRDTTTSAVRLLGAWSWRRGHLFASIGVGMSVGYERGTRVAPPAFQMPPVTVAVSRAEVAMESYLRLGAAL